MTRLRFDHCYSPDPGHRFHSLLGRQGFTLDPRTVEHPGDHSCRFIILRSRDRRRRLYLEFSSAPPKDSRRPGVSFGVEGSLEAFYRAMRTDRFLRPRLEHRNYEWKARGTKERLPGWNFLTFARKTSFAEVWFTEYEDAPGRAKARKASARLMRHPNGALSLLALEFDLDAAGRRFLEAALRRKLGPTTRLAHGTDLHVCPAADTAFRRVVVGARSLAAFRRRAPGASATVYRGRPALLLSNPAGFWDIMVVQEGGRTVARARPGEVSVEPFVPEDVDAFADYVFHSPLAFRRALGLRPTRRGQEAGFRARWAEWFRTPPKRRGKPKSLAILYKGRRVGAHTLTDLEPGRSAVMHAHIFSPEHRGLGIGRLSYVLAMRRFMRDHRLERVRFETPLHNAAALRIKSSLGLSARGTGVLRSPVVRPGLRARLYSADRRAVAAAARRVGL